MQGMQGVGEDGGRGRKTVCWLKPPKTIRDDEILSPHWWASNFYH